jgi:hypothetical protein
MIKITLDTTVREVMIPLDQVFQLAAEDRYAQARDKGYDNVGGSLPVVIWDGNEVTFVTTAVKLKSEIVSRSFQDPLRHYLGRAGTFYQVRAGTKLVELCTLARSMLDADALLVVDDDVEKPVGVIVSSQVEDLFSQVQVPGWPDDWQGSYDLDAVVHVPGETTFPELAERLRTLTIDDEAHIASYDDENRRWVVYSLQDLLGQSRTPFRKRAPDYPISGVLSVLLVKVVEPYALDEADWDTLQPLLDSDLWTHVLLTVRGEPAFVLRRKPKTTDAVLRGKGVYSTASVLGFVAEFGVAPTAEHQGRVVNTWFANEEEDPIPATHALAANTVYLLGVNVGAPDREKTNVKTGQPEIAPEIVAAAVASGEQLTLRIDSEDFYVLEQEKPVTLPEVGNTPDVYFQVATPVQTGVSRLRLGVYLRGNLVQSYQMYARIAPAQGAIPAKGVDGWWSACEYTLSMDLNDVQGLTQRGVCVWFGEGKEGIHRAGVSATGLDAGPALEVNPALLVSALERYRELLYETCFEVPEGDGAGAQQGSAKHEYRYEVDNTPRNPETFRESLLDLAELGQMLYQRVFGTDEGKRIAAQIHDIERNEREPLVVQIARLSLDAAFPWAVLYDRPLHYNPRHNAICQEFLDGDDCSKNCSVNDENVVCPYGFWGFRYVIEQPLRPPGVLSSIATQLSADGKPRLTLVYGSDLGLAESHRKAVEGVIGARAEVATPDSTDDLMEEMRGGSDVVYFYCHGGNKPYRQWLVVNEKDPFVVSYLSDDLGAKWADGAPLVVLNGCHTGKYDPSTVLSFVHRLGELGAAGVIGTEVPIHEYLGCAFGQFLFERLMKGERVGRIVYDFRRELLRSRNLLGLVYVPYCYADLRIEMKGT